MNYLECNNTFKETPTDEIQCASIEVLKEIWNKKEYRILPHAVIKHLIGNKALNELDKTLWMWLYTEAYFKENWCIQIPRYILAEFFGKNERTISRSTKALKVQGYLEVSHEDGHYATYAVRLPKAVADYIAITSLDRKSVQNESVQEASTTILDKNASSFNTVVLSTRDKSVTSLGTRMSATRDKSVNHVILNNNINTNNNTAVSEVLQNAVKPVTDPVVVCFEMKKFQALSEVDRTHSPIPTLPEKIVDVEKQMKKLNQVFDQKPKPENLRQLLLEYNRLESLRFHWQQQLTQQQEEQKNRDQTQQATHQLNTNPSYVHRQAGERPVDELNYRRLSQALMGLGYQDEERNKLLNEIIYAIRFGSLRIKQGSDKPLLIEHAISIALKLVRTGRWHQPDGLEQLASQS